MCRWADSLTHHLAPDSCVPSLSQVALVFPNNDPVAFMVAFYGCLLAEVVPVPIEVPLSRKVLNEIHLFTVKTSHLALCSLSVAIAAALQSPSFSFQVDIIPQD